MKDDYLWDKSGEPDPEIRQLEDILGTLRYQPRQLNIPAHIQPRRNFVARGLAIAAAVALVALALGVWMRWDQQSKVHVIANHTPAAVQPKDISPVKPDDKSLAGSVETTTTTNNPTAPIETPKRRLAPAGNRRLPAKQVQLSESELAEAKAAKDQLMLALRVASSKLNQAQKKTQGNETHNQHKIG